MKDLFIDCTNGLSSDMLLAALFDLGLPKSILEDLLDSLGIRNTCKYNIQEKSSYGFRGLTFDVVEGDKDISLFSFKEINQFINKSSLKGSLKKKILEVYNLLAESEASVHGVSKDQVHFHEIGSIRTLMNVSGVCAAVEYLSPEFIYCAIPPAGSGLTSSAHGVLPVPVPVVLELAKNRRIKLSGDSIHPKGELTTPTGLALAISLANCFSQPLIFDIASIGIGLGNKDLNSPNLLRICHLNSLHKNSKNDINQERFWQDIITQEAWIDDSSPEDISLFIDNLKEAGAIEVVSQSTQMKKGRQGVCIKALVDFNQAENLRNIWFSKSTTIGLKENISGRWLLPRRRGSCMTSYGEISAKQVLRPDNKITLKFDHDDLKRISLETGSSLEDVRLKAINSMETFTPHEDWSC